MMMKPHETKIPNTMGKVFGFDPLLFPVSENCENVQSDGQDTITFVFTSLSPSSHFAPPPCPSVVATKTPHFLNHPKTIFFFFSSYPSHGVEPNRTTKMSPSPSPKKSLVLRPGASISINVQILYPHCSARQSIEKGDSCMRVGRKVWCARGLEMVGRMGLAFYSYVLYSLPGL